MVVFSRKLAISLKRSNIGPMLLLVTNRKLRTRFRLVPKSTSLGDLERSLRTVFQSTRFKARLSELSYSYTLVVNVGEL